MEPSGDPFNSIRLNADNHPFNAMVNAGAIACSGPAPCRQGRRRVRLYPPRARPLRRPRARHRRGGLRLESCHRRPGPGDRLSAAHQRRDHRERARGARRLFPAMRHPGHRARHRRDGGDARQPRHQSPDRRAGGDALRDRAHALGDDLVGHVRLRRRMDLPRRHPRQERRRRRHPGGAAGSARARQLLAEARQARQQRARHQGVRGAVGALRPAHAEPQRRRPPQHHRRLQHRQEPVAPGAPAAGAGDPGRGTSRRCA